MGKENHEIDFTARHHALLFSCIAKSVIQNLGEEKGETLIRKGVRKYGEQRGKRMALRAGKYGHKLTMDNYFAYSEWEVPKHEMDFKMMQRNPHVRLNIYKCPWYMTWKENDHLEYGKYFCREIDEALVRGFNPALVIEVNSTQTNDHKPCDFLFREAGFSILKLVGVVYKKSVRPGKKAILPWDYHAGHLYKAMADVMEQACSDKSDEMMADALNDFALFFDEKHILAIKQYQATDFEQLPEKEGLA